MKAFVFSLLVALLASAAYGQDGKPDIDDFETFEAYNEALIDWKLDQRLSDQESEPSLEDWTPLQLTFGFELQILCDPETSDEKRAAWDRQGISEPVRISYCFAFLRGVHQALWRLSESLEDFRVCVPDQLTAPQLREIFQPYLDDNPEMGQASPADLVMLSLLNAFPCQD